MVLKTDELIRTGLSSELFLLAFLKSDSGYGLAQRLQNTTKNPSTGKIYPQLKSLTASRYLLNRDGKKYQLNPTKLVESIDDVLKSKNQPLDEKEMRFLGYFLARRDFFNVISKDIIQKMKEQPKGIHRIDALVIFCNKIGMISATLLFARLHRPDYVQLFSKGELIFFEQIEEVFLEFNQDWDGITLEIDKLFADKFKGISLSEREEQVFGYFRDMIKSMPSMLVLAVMPERTLKKLCLLWDQYEGFNLGVDLALRIDKKT